MLRGLLVVVLTSLVLAVQGKECGRVQVEKEGLDNRVLGGHVTQRRNWPWLVEIGMCPSGKPCMHCSGTIVSDRHVLTAAHCFLYIERKYYRTPRPYPVIAVSSHNGSFSENNIGFFDNQVNVSVHPKFDPSSESFPAYDVAIVELKKTFTFSDYDQPICIVDSFRENIGEVGYVVGYGFSSVNRTDPGSPAREITFNLGDGMLHESLIEFRTVERCSSAKYNVTSLNRHFERTICVVANNRAIAKGDSGGPLMVNRKGVWYQVGTASIAALFDVDDGRTKWMSMHSRLSRSCDWIEEVTGNYVKCVPMNG